MSETEHVGQAAPETAEAPTPSPWADLGPEAFQLLRLNPLPTDRYTGARPLRFVQLGTVERHGPHESLLRLALQLPGTKTRKERNVLDVWADHRTKQVRFGPESGLQTEPVNRGLGRFLMAQGITWAKRRWSAYHVQSIPLTTALNEDGRLTRDRFLQGLGFTVSYADEQKLKAQCHAETVGSLLADWPQEKLQLVSPIESAAMLQNADHQLQEQDARLRDQAERITRLRHDDGSLRFTIACLVTFAVFQAGLLIWIVTH
jgi:GNAT superfamily N-acetyltransferase